MPPDGPRTDDRQSGKRAIGQGSFLGSNFQGMALWQEAQELAERVARAVTSLPKDTAAQSIGSQLVRAAGSVPANIAEGYGRFSQAAYRNHLSIARGSAFEAQSWLDLLVRLGFLEKRDGARLLGLCSEVQRKLSVRMKELERQVDRRIREQGGAYEV